MGVHFEVSQYDDYCMLISDVNLEQEGITQRCDATLINPRLHPLQVECAGLR
jgi:hypothetical protein